MYYVYILLSAKDGHFYVGSTGDLRRRMDEHALGKVESTRSRRPFVLVCYEAYRSKQEAMRRELFLKSSDGKKDIRKRVRLDEQEAQTGGVA